MDILNELNNDELKNFFSDMEEKDKLTFIKIGFSVYENDKFFYQGGITAFIESIWDMSNKELVFLMRNYFNGKKEKPNSYGLNDVVEFFANFIENDYLNAFSIWYDIDFKTIYTANFKKGNFDGIFSTLPREDKKKLVYEIYGNVEVEDDETADELFNMCWEEVKTDKKKTVLKKFIEDLTY